MSEYWAAGMLEHLSVETARSLKVPLPCITRMRGAGAAVSLCTCELRSCMEHVAVASLLSSICLCVPGLRDGPAWRRTDTDQASLRALFMKGKARDAASVNSKLALVRAALRTQDTTAKCHLASAPPWRALPHQILVGSSSTSACDCQLSTNRILSNYRNHLDYRFWTSEV